MKIKELVGENIVSLSLQATTKKDVIDELVDLLAKDNRISDVEEFTKEIHKREDLGSTGIGFGVAIPHAKIEVVNQPSLVFGLSHDGIDYDSLDGEKAHIFFMIAAPATGANLHLQTLAKLSRKLIHAEFRDKLRKVTSKEELMEVLNSIDEEEK
jgi:fructose-specific phosphotransferase system IIA component